MVANTLKNKIRHQSNRWLTHNIRAEDTRACQHELRWGFRWNTQLCERVEREREQRLGVLLEWDRTHG